MVAYSNDHHSCTFQYYSYCWFIIGISPLYLFFILIMSISKEQQSVLAIIGGLLIAALISHSYIFLIIGGVVALSLPFAFFYVPLHKFWTLLSNILGWISRHIILFVLFYFFLTPFSFLLRLFGKQTIHTRSKKEKSSFSERNHVYTPDDFTNPW
jgi:hypothetical protein